MPEVPKTLKATKTKTQPWRAIWPAPESASNAQRERKAAAPESLNGMFGFNDKGEGIAPED